MNLLPSQQAVFRSGAFALTEVETDQYTAWKDGFFSFDGTPIAEVMRMLARWYDVEVVYKGPVPDDPFGGTISRFENISEVLHLLEATGKARFEVTGRRVTVMK